MRSTDYVATVARGLATLAETCTIDRLTFGDLHLESVRSWREEQLAPVAVTHDASLHFPLWKLDYAVLFDELEASGVVARICAAPSPADIAPLAIGDRFDRHATSRLPSDTDRFGEGGEFHTEVVASSLRPVP